MAGGWPETPRLRADGGASTNDLLMQMQADQLQIPVERPAVAETTALGAAFLAGLATGTWSSRDELAATWRLDRRFKPGARDDPGYARWRRAVGRAKGWSASNRSPGWAQPQPTPRLRHPVRLPPAAGPAG